VDEASVEHALRCVRDAREQAHLVKAQWRLAPATPGWAGPAHLAALTQLSFGEDRAMALVKALADADAECSERLRKEQSRSAALAGSVW
jgi:hypothetical protein